MNHSKKWFVRLNKAISFYKFLDSNLKKRHLTIFCTIIAWNLFSKPKSCKISTQWLITKNLSNLKKRWRLTSLKSQTVRLQMWLSSELSRLWLYHWSCSWWILVTVMRVVRVLSRWGFVFWGRWRLLSVKVFISLSWLLLQVTSHCLTLFMLVHFKTSTKISLFVLQKYIYMNFC